MQHTSQAQPCNHMLFDAYCCIFLLPAYRCISTHFIDFMQLLLQMTPYASQHVSKTRGPLVLQCYAHVCRPRRYALCMQLTQYAIKCSCMQHCILLHMLCKNMQKNRKTTLYANKHACISIQCRIDCVQICSTSFMHHVCTRIASVCSVCTCMHVYFTGQKLHAIRAETTRVPLRGGVHPGLHVITIQGHSASQRQHRIREEEQGRHCRMDERLKKEYRKCACQVQTTYKEEPKVYWSSTLKIAGYCNRIS